MRVLIVDDYPDTAEIAGDLLRNQGHDCRSATCGAEALFLAETFNPELAILDIGLPDMNGYELARALQGRLLKSPPFLVAMSGWKPAIDRMSDAGLEHWLMKPANLQQLLRVVELAQQRSAICSQHRGPPRRAIIHDR